MVKPVNKASSNTKGLLDKYTDKRIASMLDPDGNKPKAMTSQEHKQSTADIIDILATEQVLDTLYKKELNQINKPNQPDTLWGKYKNLWKTHPLRAATYGTIALAGAATTTFMAVLIGDRAAGGDMAVDLGLDSTFFAGSIDGDAPATTNALNESNYVDPVDTSSPSTPIDTTDDGIQANDDIKPAETDADGVILRDEEELVTIDGNNYVIHEDNKLVKMDGEYYILSDGQSIYTLGDGTLVTADNNMQVRKEGDTEYLIHKDNKLVEAGDNFISVNNKNEQVIVATGEGGEQSFFLVDEGHHIEVVNDQPYMVKNGQELALTGGEIQQRTSGSNAAAYATLGAGMAATALGVAGAARASENALKEQEGGEISFVDSIKASNKGSVSR